MSRVTKLLTAALFVLVSAGWGGCGQVVKTPKVQYVEVEVSRDLPDNLLKDCPIDEPAKGNDTVRELRRVAESRKRSLEQCNNDKSGLRKLDPKKDNER